MQNEDSVQPNAGKFVKIKSIRKLDKKEDVFCLATINGNFVANGFVIKNCDALRYASFTHKIPKTYNTDDPDFGRTLGGGGPRNPFKWR